MKLLKSLFAAVAIVFAFNAAAADVATNPGTGKTGDASEPTSAQPVKKTMKKHQKKTKKAKKAKKADAVTTDTAAPAKQ